MKSFLFTILSLLFFAESITADVREDPDAEIASLVAKIVTATTKEPGLSKAKRELSDKLVLLDQRKVVDSVIPLLKHRKEHVRDLAGYVIRECSEGVGPQHFEALKKAFHDDGGWLPFPIALLKTPEAIQFLADEFRKNPQRQGQLDWSLAKLGEQAVPHLMGVFELADPAKEQDFYDGLRYVLTKMEGEGRSAIPYLLKIVESEDREMKLRQQAALTIGFIGPPSEEVFPQLQGLAKQDPASFHDVVQRSMIASETASAARVLADKFDHDANPYIIREIALIGDRAQVVGPRVVGWLDHPEWDSRVIAARTLGAIGYKEGRKPLEAVLLSMADWRLAYAAAESLRELGMKESLPALKRAARSHWFPIVQQAAVNAMDAIRESKVKNSDELTASDIVDYVFVGRDHLTFPSEDIPGIADRAASGGNRERFSSFRKRERWLAKQFKRLRNLNGEDMLEDWGSIISFPTAEGLLLGASAWEWLGGLQFVPNEGEQKVLLSTNICGIERWQDQLFVASGMYNMDMNEGIVHRIVLVDGDLALVPWFILPGDPLNMWLTTKNEMVIKCIGGTLVFSSLTRFNYFGADGE